MSTANPARRSISVSAKTSIANAFRAELERSYQTSTAVDVKRFVNTVPARRHDLMLIPSGTIHCSGADILVLEISATPYIFTFKMYDWLRMGLDGAPRPLNIDRAFDNLCFERQGEEVAKQLVSQPSDDCPRQGLAAGSSADARRTFLRCPSVRI